MSKLIIVLFISTFSFTALANVALNSPKVVDKIESNIESEINQHQNYLNNRLEKSIDRSSNKIIMNSMDNLKDHDVE